MQAVILAAGKGKRFHSDKAKVLHEIEGKSLVHYVVELASSLGIKDKIVVIGHQGREVEKALQGIKGVCFAWQEEQRGTGHAVMMAKPYLDQQGAEVIILYGDVPGLRIETIRQLINEHRLQGNTITILTAIIEDPKWYGRILKDGQGRVIGIREAKDATEDELSITEINSGIMMVNTSFLISALGQLQCENIQGEYYLTDIVEIACKEKKKVGTILVGDNDEIKGVNSMEELEQMRRILGRRQ